VPNGCTTCHEGRTPEWAAATLDRWYDDSARRARAMVVADTFYLAGARDPAALPALASLAIDRSRGMLVRASAAEYMGQVYRAASNAAGQLTRAAPSQTSVEGTKVEKPAASTASAPSPEITTRVVNTLIGAINDPEPTVRAVAVRSLGAIRDRRAVMPIVSRLRDEVRAVRVSAAEALLWMGVSTLPGAAGELLTKAQDEYGESLAVFPDIASNHASRGWLESERGRQSDAARELDAALELEPQYARAHVYRGIVYARTGQLDDALKHWQAAKSIDPEYPNIDRLIKEAQRRSP